MLPSAGLSIVDAGVFWPKSDDPLFPLAGTFPFPSSDHRLVYVDVEVDVKVAPIPVPGAAPLLVTALGGLALARRRA